jgi:hypothetical protein
MIVELEQQRPTPAKGSTIETPAGTWPTRCEKPSPVSHNKNAEDLGCSVHFGEFRGHAGGSRTV